jgi:hypothetical protein
MLVPEFVLLVLAIRVDAIHRKVQGGSIGGRFFENPVLNHSHFFQDFFMNAFLFQFVRKLSQHLLREWLGLGKRLGRDEKNQKEHRYAFWMNREESSILDFGLNRYQ